MTSILTYLVAFLLYALIGWYFWRNKVNATGAANTSWVYYAMLIPLGLHVLTLYQSVFVGAGLNFGVGSAVSSIIFLTVFIYWLYGFFNHLILGVSFNLGVSQLNEFMMPQRYMKRELLAITENREIILSLILITFFELF